MANLTRHIRRSKKFEPLTTAVLSAALAGIVAFATSYIGVTRGQAVQETRLTTLETTSKETSAHQEQAIDKAESRLNQRLDVIQQDVREIRDGQTQLLRELTRQR